MENTAKVVVAKPTISKSAFTTDVNNGLGKNELIKKYSISSASVKEIAKTLNLTIKRTITPKYTLTDDSLVTGTTNTESKFVTTLNN